MDLDAYRFWFDVLQTVLIAAVGLHQYLITRQRVTTKAFGDLRTHIDESIKKLEDDMEVRHEQLDRRIGANEGDFKTLDGELRHMPSHDDLKNIHKRIDAVGAQVSTVGGTVQAMNNTLSIIHEHLINGGRRS